MSAQLKPLESARFEPRRSLREDSALLPMVAPQILFVAEAAGRFEALPRVSSADESATSPKPWHRRLFEAIGAVLAPYPPPYLSRHLCRDIGIDWTPEPPVRNWPW